MEPKFQNTFIPKRPVATSGNNVPSNKQGKRKGSFFGLLITLVFLLTAIAAVGLFVYTYILTSSIAQSDAQLQEAINSLEPDLIAELVVADTQLDLAEDMLGNHLAPSRFFTWLEETTLQDVQFTNFLYQAGPGSSATIEMVGVAPDYASIALQSDVFARDSNVSRSLFFNLAEAENSTDVTFEVDLTLRQSLISYQN